MPKYLIFILLTMFISACSDSMEEYLIRAEAQGTSYLVRYFASKEIEKADLDAIFENIDTSLSIYNKNSLISKVNRNENIRLNQTFIDNLSLSREYHKLSNGKLNACMGNLYKYWNKKFKQADELDTAFIKSQLSKDWINKIYVEEARLIKPESLQLDFNSFAQGYTVDKIAEYLRSKNINDFIIELGGEVFASGWKYEDDKKHKWNIAIESPPTEENQWLKSQELLNISNLAIASSGTYKRYYIKNGKKYPHIIDPEMGFPIDNNLLSVSVIAENCALADAMATAFMTMKKNEILDILKENPNIHAYIIYNAPDNSIQSEALLDFSKFIK